MDSLARHEVVEFVVHLFDGRHASHQFHHFGLGGRHFVHVLLQTQPTTTTTKPRGDQYDDARWRVGAGWNATHPLLDRLFARLAFFVVLSGSCTSPGNQRRTHVKRGGWEALPIEIERAAKPTNATQSETVRDQKSKNQQPTRYRRELV